MIVFKNHIFLDGFAAGMLILDAHELELSRAEADFSTYAQVPYYEITESGLRRYTEGGSEALKRLLGDKITLFRGMKLEQNLLMRNYKMNPTEDNLKALTGFNNGAGGGAFFSENPIYMTWNSNRASTAGVFYLKPNEIPAEITKEIYFGFEAGSLEVYARTPRALAYIVTGMLKSDDPRIKQEIEHKEAIPLHTIEL